MRHVKYVLIVLSVFLSGCLSEEEIRARQENAFDLSGTYKTTGDSEVQLNFTIANQEGKHNILVQLHRISPLSAKEREFLSELAKEHGIPEETLTAQPFPVTFGEDALLDSLGEERDREENISRDFGKTSEFYVCSYNSPKRGSKKIKKGATNMKLRIFYCFSGNVRKENKNLIEEGKLSLNASYSYEFIDKEETESSGYEEVTLYYRAEKN